MTPTTSSNSSSLQPSALALVAPTLLSSIQSVFVISDTPDDRYVIAVDIPGDYIAVCFGQDARKPAAQFRHPNLAASQARVHEFKHYRPDGGKFWTSKPGVDIWFILPKSVVTILPEKGLSYVAARIGEVPVTFNVSGGGTGGVWTDYLRTTMHVSVGHPVSDLHRVAELALPEASLTDELRALIPKVELDERSATAFKQSVARKPVLDALKTRFAEGHSLRIAIADSYRPIDDSRDGKIVDVCFTRRLKYRGPTATEMVERPGVTKIGEYTDTTDVKCIIVAFPSGNVRVTPTQIDYLRTAALNEIRLPDTLDISPAKAS